MTAWWISEFGYVSGNNEVEKRPAGTFVRMARAVDYDPHATVQVTLATLADASALTKLATLLHHTDATLKVRAIRKVSPLTAEFFYGHRCEELEKVKACKKSVIHRRSAEDTTFYVVGRLDDVHAIEKRFRDQKHISVRTIHTSHLVAVYISDRRVKMEDDDTQIHLDADNEHYTGRTVVRHLHRKDGKNEEDVVAEQSFTSVLEQLDIYEIVLEVPWWLWYVCVRFKEESKFYTTITEKVDGARLYVFAGNRAETIAAVEGFVAMLRRTIKLPVGGLFLREISAEHMPWLPSEKPPPVFPLDGFVPADDALAPNLNENSADSYYWRR